jgi:hypothetical protein
MIILLTPARASKNRIPGRHHRPLKREDAFQVRVKAGRICGGFLSYGEFST